MRREARCKLFGTRLRIGKALLVACHRIYGPVIYTMAALLLTTSISRAFSSADASTTNGLEATLFWPSLQPIDLYVRMVSTSFPSIAGINSSRAMPNTLTIGEKGQTIRVLLSCMTRTISFWSLCTVLRIILWSSTLFIIVIIVRIDISSSSKDSSKRY